jgi:uncharacterized protein
MQEKIERHDVYRIDAGRYIDYIKGQSCGNQRKNMPIGLLTLHLHLPGCSSLKEKRSKIKPVLARLRREFNVASAELDLQDVWQDALLGCVTVSSDSTQNQRLLQQVVDFTERSWPDLTLIDHRIELI